jgi:hypothetical protein
MNDLWKTLLDAFLALDAYSGPAMQAAARQAGLPEGEWRSWLITALLFDPQPISPARLRIRSPYTSPRLYSERMGRAVRQGFLVALGNHDEEYTLTEPGRQAAEEVVGALVLAIASLQPLPPADIDRLVGYLGELVQASLASPEPPGKFCLHLSRNLDPGTGAAPLVRLDQYGSDIAAYRDDAHLASWQPLAVEGHAWEAFTVIWNGDGDSLENLVKKLEPRRGYNREEYALALEDLEHRGWIIESGRKYSLTNSGLLVRQTAEKTTDAYFYAPWTVLGHEETQDLRQLLVRFKAGLEVGSQA